MTVDPLYQVSCFDNDGLPVAVVSGGEGHPHAHHPLAGWRLKANVYLDGSVRLFSGEFGSRFFGPAPFHTGARRAALQFAALTVDIDYNRLGARRELGLGTFTARVEFPKGTLIHRVIIPDMDGRELLMAWEWEGGVAPTLLLPVESPAVAGPYGRVYYVASGSEVRGDGPTIRASLGQPLVIRAGYTAGAEEPPAVGIECFGRAWARLGEVWRRRLARIRTSFTGERLWELRWSVGLMLGSCIRDGARGQLACTNGALYAFDHLSHEFDQPNASYSFRDGNQVAFALCAIEPGVAREQILRSFTAFRSDWGIPQASNARPGGEHIYKTPGSSGGEVHSVAFASEQTYWAILALTEYVAVVGDCRLLDERIVNAQGETKTVREHLDDMLRFSDDTVGFGANGICRFLSGDWNDYLDDIGSRGRGESFMNAALDIIAKSRLAAVDDEAGRPDSALRLRTEAEAMRARVAPYCRGRWYPRAIADDGRLLGGSGDRLYADAQGWLAMAGCGDAAFRRQALLTTMEHCLDPIGLRIMDRPLQPAERAGISRVPYAPGTGENGGIWWITGHWLAMALDQEGLADEALRVYDACSMRNHHRLFPREWWSPLMSPDGIDGPASPDYGRAQQPPGCNRESNPNESAKFAYALWFATHRGGGLCWENAREVQRESAKQLVS